MPLIPGSGMRGQFIGASMLKNIQKNLETRKALRYKWNHVHTEQWNTQQEFLSQQKLMIAYLEDNVDQDIEKMSTFITIIMENRNLISEALDILAGKVSESRAKQCVKVKNSIFSSDL